MSKVIDAELGASLVASAHGMLAASLIFMQRSLSMSIRRVVLFALTPASAIGCGHSPDGAANPAEAAPHAPNADARPAAAGRDSELDATVDAVAAGDVSTSDTTANAARARLPA